MLPRWTTSLEGGPRRVNHSAVIVAHKIYMFGGYCMGEDYEQQRPIDVHVFNTYSNRWSKIPFEVTHNNDLSQVPYMRYGHASVSIKEKAYLWGGRNDTEGACHQLFTFDTSKLKWKRNNVKGNHPGARDGHAMCVAEGNIYVFGGYEEEADIFSNEMFKLDMRTMTWSMIIPEAGNPASWRDFHTITSHGNLIYVFGGRGDRFGPFHSNQEVYDSTLKVFDTRRKQWTEPVSSQSVYPCGRRSHSAFLYNDCLYIFGGYNSELDKHFNDLWKYDPDSHVWNEVETCGQRPAARRRQCCCLHGEKLYMFGGTSPAAEHVQTVGDQSGDYEEGLHDHNDTHVLDFCTSLKTLCLVCALHNNLDLSKLPGNIRWEARMMITPNNISKSLSHG